VNKFLLKILSFILFLFPIITNAQNITVSGDSLVGKILNGEKIREVIGNVIITDKKSQINCNRAIQYLGSGNFELFGNVVFSGDTLQLFTEHAFYISQNKTGIIDTNLLVVTKLDSIFANKGKYFTDSAKVNLFGNVKLLSKGRKVFADTLFFFRRTNILITKNNVSVSDTNSQLFCNFLRYDKPHKITFAKENVYIRNKDRESESISDIFSDSALVNHSVLNGEPIVIKIDTSGNSFDTMFVKAERIDVKKDTSVKLIANDSVKILRKDFALVSDSAFFDNDSGIFKAFKKDDATNPVILWFENNQITGDTVVVFIKKNNIEKVNISGNVLLIEKIDEKNFRYNQIQGENIDLFFEQNKLKKLEVKGRTLSIYYVEDKDESQGLIKSSSSSAKIEFDKNGVSTVKLYGNPESEFHPEKTIAGKERDFLLPDFIIYENRPKKKDFLNRFISIKNQYSKMLFKNDKK